MEEVLSATHEASEILTEFAKLLAPVIADGNRKRGGPNNGVWKTDPGHEPALHRHLIRYDMGERVDSDSGAHPLVHAAFRCLAIAWQETHVVV